MQLTMDPVALRLGPLTIRWYGVMVAVGFLVAFQIVQKRARRFGFTPANAADLSFLLMLGGIVGGRALYVLTNWSEFRGNLIEIIRIDHGGLVFYGGFLGALAFGAATCWVKSWHPLRVADLFVPALPVGHALGRIGCLLNGCCFGKPWHHAAAISYPAAVEGAAGALVANGPWVVQVQKGLIQQTAVACAPVFPIQLLATAANLLIVAGLLAWERMRPHRRGELGAIYLLLYSATRFATEFGRGDYVQAGGWMTPAQKLCLFLFPAGLVLLGLVRCAPAVGETSDA